MLSALKSTSCSVQWELSVRPVISSHIPNQPPIITTGANNSYQICMFQAVKYELSFNPVSSLDTGTLDIPILQRREQRYEKVK